MDHRHWVGMGIFGVLGRRGWSMISMISATGSRSELPPRAQSRLASNATSIPSSSAWIGASGLWPLRSRPL